MKSDKEEKRKDKRKIYLDTNLQIIFGITLAYIMGVSSITPAFPKIVKELNISFKDVGLLITAFSFPGILLVPFLGVIADRWGRKRIIIPFLMLFGIAGGLCFFVRDFELLLILRLIQGIGAAPLGSLTITIIGDLYSGKELIAAMGYNSSIRSIGSASYPAIGGALAMIGWHYPFILPVIAVPIGFFVLFNLKVPEQKNELHIREHLNIVWKKLRSRRIVGLLVIGIIIFIMLFGSYMTCFPLLLGNSFSASPFIIGLIMASVSLIAAFTSSQLGKIIKLFSRKTILKISFFLYTLALLIIPFISQLRLFFIPVIIFGIAHGMSIPVIQALFAEAAPLKYRATFMSVSGMTFRVGQTLGPFLIGLVIGVWGIGGAFYAGAVLSIAMFIIVLMLK
ncbi:MAG: MFS transporter [Candidatus Caldatribacteriota bacterium]|nr:MFS transporter [Candidatus Caldatribacteriota bacterium]